MWVEIVDHVFMNRKIELASPATWLLATPMHMPRPGNRVTFRVNRGKSLWHLRDKIVKSIGVSGVVSYEVVEIFDGDGDRERDGVAGGVAEKGLFLVRVFGVEEVAGQGKEVSEVFEVGDEGFEENGFGDWVTVEEKAADGVLEEEPEDVEEGEGYGYGGGAAGRRRNEAAFEGGGGGGSGHGGGDFENGAWRYNKVSCSKVGDDVVKSLIMATRLLARIT
ncbi:hypothetical protein STAS_30784 [Striga asiatica]|uniref:Uncharacterized protein n=1 Tax=Striga asiatica TaxID=4170 RepID=A0A5A7R761_STRAF|nr:hypothetical protein STAS_30784 [Striga asiatica]